jgi:putative oxidoreductase
MPESSISFVLSKLSGVYQFLDPFAETCLRISVGLALVPHGLRMTFGLFPNTGQPLRNIGMLADYLDKQGYRWGKALAPAISATQLVCGPLLALGLFTHLVAVPVVLFLLVSNVERWRVGRYFWNQLGLEYTLMWTLTAFYFLVHGGGAYSLDRLITDAAQLQHWGASY